MKCDCVNQIKSLEPINLPLGKLAEIFDTSDKVDDMLTGATIERKIIIPKGKVEKFDITKFGPYRFIGKSVPARGHGPISTTDIFRSLWHYSDWIFNKLDEMSEYASDEKFNCALIT